MDTNYGVKFATYVRVKKDLKWYVKLWNIITFKKEKNYEYKLLEIGLEKVKD